jgi:hypothetical protein
MMLNLEAGSRGVLPTELLLQPVSRGDAHAMMKWGAGGASRDKLHFLELRPLSCPLAALLLRLFVVDRGA